MKDIKLRRCNDVCTSKTFSAHLCGGGRGFDDAMALETYSNDIVPTLRTIIGFITIIQVYEK